MNKTRKLILSALFTALICASTFIHIPAGSGYIHPADGVLLTGAFLLGPLYGTVAAAIGSALADIFSGYVLYSPATFIIKGLMALAGYFVFCRKKTRLSVVIASVIAEFIMVFGYFAYELIFYREFAFLNIPANLIQGTFGVVIALILSAILNKRTNK